MGRPFLIAPTLYYLTAVVRILLAVRDRIAPHGRFSFFAIGGRFLFQTATYRLSLTGAFTAPLVFAPQTFAVVGSELIPSRTDRKDTIHCIHLGSGNPVREKWKDQLPKA